MENEEVWAPQFARLWVPPKIERHPHWGEIPRFRSIQFLSCSTAASPEGRELLQRIADVGNLRVSAGTGLLIATSQYAFWEKGAQIACCVPRDAARPNGYVECPEGNWREPSALADANFQFMGMKNLGFGPGMEVADVESISVKTPSSNDEIELPKEEAAELLPLIFSSPPYAKDGELTAALTARFTVKYRSQPAITVDLLADRLAQVDVQRVFLVAQGIRAFLKRFGIS
ncbi:hypothetical protein [Cupriavidus sp. RAF12]|uniref:hypothetical protein n=1 Tax=Cupriavidus sp. RAF12 TaxID=3233050 RepID=UPI003F8EC859